MKIIYKRFIEHSLQWALTHRVVTLAVALGLLVGSVVFIAPQLGTDLFASGKSKRL